MPIEEAWEQVKQCTVAITNTTGDTIGTGFYISMDGLILTCAHVVKDAKGVDSIRIKGKKVYAVYIANEDDFAVLKEENYQGDAVSLSTTYKLSGYFRSFGYGRPDFPAGATINGTITDANLHCNYGSLPMLRLSIGIDAQRVEPGESGAPVFDIENAAVIGLIAAYDRKEGALAVSLETVKKKWPGFNRVLSESGCGEQKELTDELHKIIVKEMLTPPYNAEQFIRLLSYDEYYDFFKYFITAQTTNSVKPEFNSFESFSKVILENIENTSDLITLLVQGSPGTGKTSFLNILYWFLYDQYHYHKTSLLPIFIDCHIFRKSILKSFNNLDKPIDHEQLSSNIEKRLESLKKLANLCPNQRLLIIIADYDSDSILEKSIYNYVTETYPSHAYVIEPKNKSIDIISQSNLVLSFKPLQFEIHAMQELIKAFSKIVRINIEYHEIEKLVNYYKCEEIDLFTLFLLKYTKMSVFLPASRLPSLTMLLWQFCRDYFKNNKNRLIGKDTKPLDFAAQIVFNRVVKQLDIPNEENLIYLDLAYTHPKVCDYIIAYHMTNELFKIKDEADGKVPDKFQALSFMQPSSVNNFCKEIINQDDDNQRKAIKAIEILLQAESSDDYAKAFGCYLAGRVEWDPVRSRACRILKDFKNNLKLMNSQSKLFLYRTTYISLSYLNDADAQRDYINMLLSDPKADQLNRGFHLEYYGDENFSPLITLMNKDHLRPFPRTFKRLSESIQEKNNPLFEIEMQTICSLAQHRHAEGILDNNNRQELLKIIDLNINRIIHGDLRKYIRMVRKHFDHEYFSIGHIFDDYYKIKFEKRKGWLKRGITNGESVADHIYGAYLIALFLLPERSEEHDSYSKDRILDMLLHHDLAEAIVHDTTPDEQTQEFNRKEAEVYDEIKMLSTYNNGLSKLKIVSDLWNDFESGGSINAKVAKEIDRIENWVQLQIYKAKGCKIIDYDNWSNSLINDVTTGLGLRVLNKIRPVYGDIEKLRKKYMNYLNNLSGDLDSC
jgi:5'-deoxynucleotidase YfbR-like HD superfamily hydrolase